MTLVRIAAVASLALVVAALGGVARPDAAQSADEATPAGLTVTGLGSVRTVPDRASFSFGVETQAATARAALTQNAAEAKKLLDALRAAGIAAADLQTSQVSLNPRTDERGTGIVGYSAITTVTATLRDLSRAGAVVDAAVDAGANTVSGPSLTRGDTDAQYRQALRLAYADARTKAEALAAAAGKTLGAVTAIVESSSGSVPYAVAKDAAASTAVEIAPGTQSVDAVVTVTFALS
jgi:uncharacterized protein YggE